MRVGSFDYYSDILVPDASVHNAMINASSANPTALAVTREGMDRVDRNKEREFE